MLHQSLLAIHQMDSLSLPPLTSLVGAGLVSPTGLAGGHDDHDDQSKLDATIAKLNTRVGLLDPLVRLHRLDENNAREISGLLGFIRASGTSPVHLAWNATLQRPAQLLKKREYFAVLVSGINWIQKALLLTYAKRL